MSRAALFKRRPTVHALLSILLLGATMLTTSPAAALAATGDGGFTVTDAISGPEPSDNTPLSTEFPELDGFDLPWFPTTASPTTCTVNNAGGIAVLMLVNTPLPCGPGISDATNNNGIADRLVVDGYVFIPDGATELWLQVTNDNPDTSSFLTGVKHLYTAPSDSQNDRVFRTSISTPFNVEGSVNHRIASVSGSSLCINSPAVAYRLYVLDRNGGDAFSIKWNVVGGANDTAGAYELIPTNHLSSLAGYDNDLDNNALPDYQEADTDGDTIPDWQEMGQAIEGDTLDTDSDGNPNCSDTDSDNDGSTDGVDPNRLTPTASPDTVTAAQREQVSTSLTANDSEFAGTNNSVVDLGTGTASGYTLSASGALQWDTSNVTTGTHTVDYRICNNAVSPAVCASTTATITITQEADLTTTVSYPSSAPAPGQDTSFSVTLTNNGASNATNAAVAVVLPTSTMLNTDSLPNACAALTGTTLRCTHSGAAGASQTYSIPVQISVGAAPNSLLSGGSATATSNSPDPNSANNTTLIQLSTGPRSSDFTPPHLSTGTAPLSPGSSQTITTTTTNNGPSSALSAPTTRFVLPAGLTFDVTAPNPSNCAIDSTGPPQTLTCTPGGSPAPTGTIQTILQLEVGASVVCLDAVSITVEQLPTDPTDPGTISVDLPLTTIDSDNDTVPNATELGPNCNAPIDTDGDGTPDYLDTDSDNDGIADSDETQNGADVDSDDDTTPDRLDPIGATITGAVFLDQNLDGIQQQSESDISAVTVRLSTAGPDAAFGTIDDIIVAVTTTQSPYSFTNVSDGSYAVSIDADTLPYAVYATHELDGTVVVADNAATFVTEPSFGQFYASVSGTLTDSNNAAIANAVITITDSDGNILTTTTDQSGQYLLQGGAATPIVRGAAIISTTIDGHTEIQAIQIDGAQAVIEPIIRSELLPVTGMTRTQVLLGVGLLMLLAGALIGGVQRLSGGPRDKQRAGFHQDPTVV